MKLHIITLLTTYFCQILFHFCDAVAGREIYPLPQTQQPDEACYTDCLLSDCNCVPETAHKINTELRPRIRSLLNQKFFRYYKVALNRECHLWPESGFCMVKDCSVEEENESLIVKDVWQNQCWHNRSLSAIEKSVVKEDITLMKCCQEKDFCYFNEDESDSIYINLLKNEERYTGYEGISAHRIWATIYRENCFETTVQSHNKGQSSAFSSSSLLSNVEPHQEEIIFPTYACATSNERKIFYKLISGFHASVSTHLSYKFLFREIGAWGKNYELFCEKVRHHPERLENLYFVYLFVLRAVAKLAPFLSSIEFCTGDPLEDVTVGEEINWLKKFASTAPQLFDELSLFHGSQAGMKQELKEHFRKIGIIMDCVGCERCQLWGKLQILGIGTALKLIFSYNDDEMPRALDELRATEVVALFNTLGQLSDSIAYVDDFDRTESLKNIVQKLHISGFMSFFNSERLESWSERFNEPISNVVYFSIFVAMATFSVILLLRCAMKDGKVSKKKEKKS